MADRRLRGKLKEDLVEAGYTLRMMANGIIEATTASELPTIWSVETAVENYRTAYKEAKRD